LDLNRLFKEDCSILLQCRLYSYNTADNYGVTCILAVMAMLTGLTNCGGMRIHSQEVEDNHRLSRWESTHDARLLHLTQVLYKQ